MIHGKKWDDELEIYYQTYESWTDAIHWEIRAAIAPDDDPANYDLDAIAGKVLGDYSDGYRLIVDSCDFWKTVADHRLT